MKVRILTRQEEEAIRQVHHDHIGEPKRIAAKRMGISIGRLNQILRSVKKKAPQLFPVLTPRQAFVRKQLDDGWDHYRIANHLEITVRQVDNTVAQLHKLGVPIYHRPRTISYSSDLDGEVIRKF